MILWCLLYFIPLVALTLFIPMQVSIKIHIFRSELSMVYIEGSQVIISNKNISSLKVDFVFAKLIKCRISFRSLLFVKVHV